MKHEFDTTDEQWGSGVKWLQPSRSLVVLGPSANRVEESVKLSGWERLFRLKFFRLRANKNVPLFGGLHEFRKSWSRQDCASNDLFTTVESCEETGEMRRRGRIPSVGLGLAG